MRRFKILVFSLICLQVFCSAAFAAGAVDAIVNAVQARYDKMKSMEATFTQTLLHKESGTKDERTGVLYFTKPLQVRWETKTPAPELLIVTPEVIWNVFPDEDMAYKYPASLANDSRSIVRVVTGQTKLTQDFTIERAGTEKGLVKLRLYPKEPTQALTEAAIWVEQSTGLIKRVLLIDFYNNQNDISFTSQKVDTDLPKTLFAFTPPAKMKVEDRTNSGVVQKPLMR